MDRLESIKNILSNNGFFFIEQIKRDKILTRCTKGHDKIVNYNRFFNHLKVNTNYKPTCYDCVPKYQKTIDKAVKFLESIEAKVNAIEEQTINWTCRNDHTKTSKAIALSYEKGCEKCPENKAHGRKPKYPDIGTQKGNLEVIEHLGVINGYAKIKVRNNDNKVEADLYVYEWNKGKRKLLNKEELFLKNQKQGRSMKGVSNVKLTKYTWQDLLNICQKIGFTIINCPEDKNSKIYNVTNSNNQWHIRCHCGNIFYPMLTNIYQDISRSCGCVKSQAQNDLTTLIKSWGFNVITNEGTTIQYGDTGGEIDIYVPEKRIGIEHDGLYWHGAIKKREDKKRGKYRLSCYQKTVICKEKDVRLITIFEDEWLTKKQQTIGYLKAIFGKNDIKIHGRKCIIKGMNSQEKIEFLNNNHIQGNANGMCYGLYYNEELVACAVFCKPNASRNNVDQQNTIELSRYCVKIGYSVRGGLGKLLNCFINNNKDVYKIISYSDNRWSAGHIYESLNFIKESNGKPSHWYFKNHSQGPREHRYKWRKQVALEKFGGNPVTDTEWSIMERNGYDKIYDCGSSRWVLKTC